MKYKQFTRSRDNTPIFINPDYVVALAERDDGTAIYLAGADKSGIGWILVQEEVLETIDRLER